VSLKKEGFRMKKAATWAAPSRELLPNVALSLLTAAKA
jgi:hypothetical protein